MNGETAEMRQEILRLTGRRVHELAAEIALSTGTVAHAFTTGAMAQVYLLSAGLPARTRSLAVIRPTHR